MNVYSETITENSQNADSVRTSNFVPQAAASCTYEDPVLYFVCVLYDILLPYGVTKDDDDYETRLLSKSEACMYTVAQKLRTV